jgi:hypothetical protein
VIPDLSNPQSWNRYSYVTNRPVNFSDPTGHIAACDEYETCKVEREFSKLDAKESWKKIIKDKFDVEMSDDVKKWDLGNLIITYGALSNIDTALGGMLKTLLGGTVTFKHDYTKDQGGNFSGWTSPGSITFYYVNRKIPYMNIYHEFGHLLNFAFDKMMDNALDSRTWSADGEIIMGRDSEGYHRNNWPGYKDRILNDPAGFTVSALQHPAGEYDFDGNGNSSTEDWGDMFANFVAGNIDQSTLAGKTRYDFVLEQLGLTP